MRDKINRKDCGDSGAVTVSRSRTSGKALLPWAAAAAMLLGSGGLAVQAQTFEPQDKCSVSGTKVTCTGDLSNGVDVEDSDPNNPGTYTTLVVKDLTNNVVLADGMITDGGVYFNSVSDIDITVDTGDFRIITLDSCKDCPGIATYSVDSAVTVRFKGIITTSGISSEGIDAGSSDSQSGGGNVTVKMTGYILTEGEDSTGIYANSDGGIGIVAVEVTGNIETKGGNSKGIFAKSSGGNIDIKLNGGTITSNKDHGIEFVNGNNNTLTIRNAVTISGGLIDVKEGIEINDVKGGIENEKIDNYGTLTTSGTIDLGEGLNNFNNMADATFNSGAVVKLRHVGDTSLTNDIFTNWGNLSPGGASAVQTTKLWGDFTNQESGTFTVTIGPENSSDQLNVTRGALLAGGTLRIVGAYAGTYTILDSARITGPNGTEGTFDEVVIGSIFMTFTPDYVDEDGDNYKDTVKLTATRNTNKTFLKVTGVSGTPNQRAVARVLDYLEGNDPDNSIVRAVLGLYTAEEVRAAEDTISGEMHVSLKGALMDTGQRKVTAINRSMDARLGNPGAQTSTAVVGNLSSLADDRSGFWMTSYSPQGETDATYNTARMDTDLDGVVFGIDSALGERWRFGVLGGYSQTDVTQRARSSSGSVDALSLGLYGGAEVGASRLRFGAMYNKHSIDTRRSVGFAGERVSASYDARSTQFFAEVGHQIQIRNLMLEPFAGVSHTSLDTNGFTETGGAAALTSSSDSNSTTFATLGLRGSMELQDKVHARAMAGWQHAFGDTEPSSTFKMADSPQFSIMGAPVAQDTLVAELGIEAGISDNVVLGVDYKGRYGDGNTVHGLNAGIKMKF